jgi:hypothetical protein
MNWRSRNKSGGPLSITTAIQRVIASGAKQSRHGPDLDCFVASLLAMTKSARFMNF